MAKDASYELAAQVQQAFAKTTIAHLIFG